MLQKNKMLGLAAACTLLGIGTSGAAVTAHFSEVGNNVVVIWTGSYNVPTPNETFYLTPGSQGYSAFGNPGPWTALAGIANGDDSNAVVVGGQLFPIAGITLFEGTYSGSAFGFDLQGNNIVTEGCIILPKNYAGNATYTPTGTMTFANVTLDDIFGNSLPNNQLAFRGAGSVNGDREIYITAVPEPSSTLMLGLFATAALFTRKRATRSFCGVFEYIMPGSTDVGSVSRVFYRFSNS